MNRSKLVRYGVVAGLLGLAGLVIRSLDYLGFLILFASVLFGYIVLEDRRR
jgi:hypothetical protein